MTEEQLIQEENYSASNIQVLEGLEAVRKRPAMYIGDISEKGLHHLVNETVDNSIDEAMAGFCTHIEVTINEDNSITVQDNGRGIPVDEHEKMHKSALEVVMTVLHAGGKFDKGSYKVSGGLHGVGVSCVNALSTRMMSQVFRNGHIYQQEYEKGKPLYDVKIVGDTDKTGTRQQFWPDATIFTTTEYKYDIIARRMRELAYLNAGITITLTDLRRDEEGNLREPEVFHAKDGLKEFVRYVDRHRTHLFDDVIYLKTEKQGTPIEVAVMYNTDYSENIHSYVNNINTIEGGTHLAGFRAALTRTLKKYADNDPQISKQIEKAKIEIAPEDFREGLTAVISIKVAEPQFEGQTKTKLGNSEVAGAVQQAVGEALANYLEEHPKEAKLVCDKVVLAATARIAARKARESVQRKNPMTGGGLPGKLADCSNKDPKDCEIFLVEGDSAGGSAKQGRDRHFQAILPLRGKILNVEKVQWHRVFEAESVMNIIQSIGVRFGVEGEGFNYVDGTPVLSDLIINNPDGLSYMFATYKYASGQATTFFPGVFDMEKGFYDPRPGQLEALDTLSELTDGAWIIDRGVQIRLDLQTENASISTEMSTYADGEILKFILGDRSLDTYDDFLATVESMGLDRMTEIQQIAYDTYKANVIG